MTVDRRLEMEWKKAVILNRMVRVGEEVKVDLSDLQVRGKPSGWELEQWVSKWTTASPRNSFVAQKR